MNLLDKAKMVADILHCKQVYGENKKILQAS